MLILGLSVSEIGRYTPSDKMRLSLFSCCNSGRDGEKQEYNEDWQHYADNHADGRLDKQKRLSHAFPVRLVNAEDLIRAYRVFVRRIIGVSLRGIHCFSDSIHGNLFDPVRYIGISALKTNDIAHGIGRIICTALDENKIAFVKQRRHTARFYHQRRYSEAAWRDTRMNQRAYKKRHGNNKSGKHQDAEDDPDNVGDTE